MIAQCNNHMDPKPMTRGRSDQLAILGGEKTIKNAFNRYNSLGAEEVAAAQEVVSSGLLSQFIGAWGRDFNGGPKVKEFERKCEAYFGVKHAISVNSWTSGLIASVGAIGIAPGDEVIVTPFTMCASATAIVHWNAIPVFADIEPDTFCLDVRSVEANITPKTRAIMSVDIFGQSADMDELMSLARKHNLKVISDTAQAPGATYKGRYAGTLADVGGYSLNYHKHIHTGEGGIVVTDNDTIANRVRLIRNHAEAVVGEMGEEDLTNMVGYNFRLGEIESAIGIAQLGKLADLASLRRRLAERLTDGLSDLKGLKTPVVRADSAHVFYVYPLVLDLGALAISRSRIIEALRAEGVEGLSAGYQNVHLLPMYQKKIAFGPHGFPWRSSFCNREVSYAKGICPVAEELHDKSFVTFAMCQNELSESDIDLIIAAFRKVWANLDALSA